MRTKVLYMLALLLVLSVGQADAQRILPRMQGMEMRGGMASDNGYYMGNATIYFIVPTVLYN